MFDPSKKCPLLRKKCIQHDCVMFVPIRGRDPQTGHPIDQHGCAFVWQLVAAFEGNKEIRQAASATESFRNVVAAGQGPVLPGSRVAKLLEDDPDPSPLSLPSPVSR